MAKPSSEISKTDFKDNYNVVKVLTDKIEIMQQLKTFNSKNQTIAFGTKKKPKETEPPLWFQQWSKEFETKINTRLENIESRIQIIEDKLVRNNIN